VKISKHVHSCLRIEENGKTVIVDPGNYTFEANALDLGKIVTLNYLLITHEHPDHLYIPLVLEIDKRFPNCEIISNKSVAEILKKEGIEVNTKGNKDIKIKEVPHERIFSGDVPQNTLFEIFGKLTHPGDSLHFDLNTDVLALPVQAPWCSTTEAVETGKNLKPRIIIPVHDWHWNETARNNFYGRFKDYFKNENIEFIGLTTGELIEI